MNYCRMPIEKESPEELGYGNIRYNLAESSVTDLTLDEINVSLSNLKLEYIGHMGNLGLRKAIAKDAGVREDEVLLTVGAAGALFIINTSLLAASDHLVVVRPNYATNIVVPQTIGCSISYIDLALEEGWRVDPGKIEAAIQPNTKLLSITSPHNPTGMVMSDTELAAVIEIAERRNIYLLVDETYRDACFKTSHPIMAAKSKKIISVSSLSKAFGLPGLRMGWVITQDAVIMERFLAAKEMIHINNSALDEEVSYQFYLQKEAFAEKINAKAQRNFQILAEWLKAETRLEAVLPAGGVVCFPRIKASLKVDTAVFYKTLLDKYGTFVGPGHWFSMDDRYMRVGFGWVDETSFRCGLEGISSALSEQAEKPTVNAA